MAKSPAKKPARAKAKPPAAKARAAKEAKAAARTSNGTLPDQQELFCREYIIDMNGTQAAIRAGYSAKTAPTQAARLLRNAHVERRIFELKRERLQRIDVSADMVVQHLAAIATTHLGHVADWDGEDLTLRASRDLTYAEMMAVKKVTMTKTTLADGVEVSRTAIEVRDNMKALALLGQHFNVFSQKNNGLPKRAVLFNFTTNQQEETAGSDDA